MSVKWQETFDAYECLIPVITQDKKLDKYAKEDSIRVAMNLASYARMYPDAVKLAASKIDSE